MNAAHKDMLIDVLRHVATGGAAGVSESHFDGSGANTIKFVRNSKLSRLEVAQVVFERLGFAGTIVSAYISSSTAQHRSIDPEGDETGWLPPASSIAELEQNEPFLDAVAADLFLTTVNAKRGTTTEPNLISDDEASALKEAEWATVAGMFDDVIVDADGAADQRDEYDADEDEDSGDDYDEISLRLATADGVPIKATIRVFAGYPNEDAAVIIPATQQLSGRARKIALDAAADCVAAQIGECCLMPLIAGLKDAVSDSLSAPMEEAKLKQEAIAAQEAQRRAAEAAKLGSSAASESRQQFLEKLVARDQVERPEKRMQLEVKNNSDGMARNTRSAGHGRGAGAAAAGSKPNARAPPVAAPIPPAEVGVAMPEAVKLRAVDAQAISNEFIRTSFMRRDPRVDQSMFEGFQKLQATGALSKLRQTLPAFQLRQALKDALVNHRVVVIGGDTGSGKTTQIPQYVLEYFVEEKKGSMCSIVCTQPRRLAATAVALRVAEERDEPIGASVGYSIRLESRIGPQTRLLYCTTGILLRRMQADPQIGTISHVIVDEIHERGVDTDFLLILLRDLLQKRKDLTVVLMSATMDAAKFSDYFGGAPVLTIPGRTHPVQVIHVEKIIPTIGYIMEEGSRFSKLEGVSRNVTKLRNARHTSDIAMARAEYDDVRGNDQEVARVAASAAGSSGEFVDENTAYTLSRMDPDKINYELIDKLVEYIDRSNPKCDGAVLIFMPGLAEITRCIEELRANQHLATRCILFNLHSSLGSAEQKAVFAKPPRGKRKVIVGTNIMETSITIDDAVYVIDCGKFKENRYDPRKSLSQLVTCWVSKANARQRTGRAGRVRPGICYRLYTTGQYEMLDDHQTCEMHRVPLESLILQIHVLNLGDELTFLRKALDPPVERAVQGSVAVLTGLGALSDGGVAGNGGVPGSGGKQLTSLGYHLANLPLDVRIGKMIIVGAVLKCLDPVLTMAACLSTKTPFQAATDDTPAVDAVRRAFSRDYNSDLLSMYFAYSGWQNALNAGGDAVARKYCMDSYLSQQALHQIQSTKMQYEAYLIEAGFVVVKNADGVRVTQAARRGTHFISTKYVSLDNTVFETGGRSYNVNSPSVKCVVACLVAGMYPNVAKLAPRPQLGAGPGASGGYVSHFVKACTKDGSEVCIHPSSVNGSKGRDFSYPFVCYVEKVKTSQTFVRETTMVSPYALVLFGGPSVYLAEYAELVFDNWVSFGCAEEDAVLLMRLREQLESALTMKINDPTIEWESTAGNVVRAMEKLLKEEGSRSLIVVDRRNRPSRYVDPNQGAAGAAAAAGAAKRPALDKRTVKMNMRQRLVTCFNCAEKGHLAKDCTNRPAGIGPSEACFICGARAHYPTQCPVLNPPPSTASHDADDDAAGE